MNLKKLFGKKEEVPRCSVVIVAAGSSQRMGADKIMGALGGLPVLVRTIFPFQNCDLVKEIVVVTRRDKLEHVADLRQKYGLNKVSKIICGGTTRMESALAGVSETDPKCNLIAIHDGARPLVTEALIRRAIYAAQEHLAVVPVLKSVDTLKTVDENGVIVGSVDRESTVRIQTPQVFEADLIKGALTYAVKNALPLTDDGSAVERMGVQVHTVEGESENLKLTVPQDRVLAEAILLDGGDVYADRPWL